MAELAGWGNSEEPSFEKPEAESLPVGLNHYVYKFSEG